MNETQAKKLRRTLKNLAPLMELEGDLILTIVALDDDELALEWTIPSRYVGAASSLLAQFPGVKTVDKDYSVTRGNTSFTLDLSTASHVRSNF